jgi:hypothetical protein
VTDEVDRYHDEMAAREHRGELPGYESYRGTRYERGQLVEAQDPNGDWLPAVVLADVDTVRRTDLRSINVAIRGGRHGNTWTVTRKGPEQVRLPEGGSDGPR